jgi:hypothetical protein
LENSNQFFAAGEQALGACSSQHCDKTWAKLYARAVGQDRIFDKTKWNWPINAETVMSELKKGPLVVLMAQDPFNNHEQDTVEQLSKITDDFVVLSGNARYFLQPTRHICYFPYWYLCQKNLHRPVLADDHPRRFAISSLNGKSKYHRIENYIKLRQRPYFDQLLFSMNNNFDLAECRLETQIEFWNDQIVEQFQSLLSTQELNQGHYQDHSINHPAYSNSYVNYVTETSIRTKEIFCSEKTWKPFMSGQFGIWLSNPGHVEFLRFTGLDVFDDVFDNHHYDVESNLNQRIDLIHATIDHIMSIDLDKVYQATLSRRQANIDRFYSDMFEAVLTKQCEDYQL